MVIYIIARMPKGLFIYTKKRLRRKYAGGASAVVWVHINGVGRPFICPLHITMSFPCLIDEEWTGRVCAYVFSYVCACPEKRRRSSIYMEHAEVFCKIWSYIWIHSAMGRVSPRVYSLLLLVFLLAHNLRRRKTHSRVVELCKFLGELASWPPGQKLANNRPYRFWSRSNHFFC